MTSTKRQRRFRAGVLCIGVALLVSGTARAGFRDEVLADNPFLYYEFAETAGMTAVDSSGKGNEGTYREDFPGGFSLGAKTVNGFGVALDGESKAYIETPATGVVSGVWTLELIVDVEALDTGCCTSLFSTVDYPEPPGGGAIHLNVEDVTGLLLDAPFSGESLTPDVIPVGVSEFVHIVITEDNDTDLIRRVYINGELVGEPTLSGEGPSSFHVGNIGGWTPDPERHVTGIFDEFAFYDTILSEDRVRAHFQAIGTPVLGDNQLFAGDANQDFEFNQFDLVQVQVAAKYLTGQSATWGQGDWDGAPGGAPGSPPPGNGRFDQLDIIAALDAAVYLTGPYHAVRPGGQRNDGQTSILYDARTGEVAVDAPAGTQLTSINIDSAAGIFSGDPAQNLGGSFDNDSDSNIFKATFGSSFGSISFGHVAQPGLGEAFVLGDLTIVGSLAGGGGLGDVDLIYVPEPPCAVLLAWALVALLVYRRKRQQA